MFSYISGLNSKSGPGSGLNFSPGRKFPGRCFKLKKMYDNFGFLLTINEFLKIFEELLTRKLLKDRALALLVSAEGFKISNSDEPVHIWHK